MDIACLEDLYFKFNEMNKLLQSNELSLIKTELIPVKADVVQMQLRPRRILPISDLAKVSKEVKILEDYVHIYCQHLEMSHEDFLRRFDDLVIRNWVLYRFFVNALNVDIYL
ncbi:LOW QUALITY PROTEIN: hypothetical protein M514_00970 [Trichuris suis]|uniref:Uncharacterized protein n=1 Tax=Trichuris suis TaxID=68888 RepID=A0A085NLX5_9BILA|nr:LOW QUALITY PROTEIN: hypothetical protein M513_00970 [Trichuris suis]KFD70471.1 LOW QUALITY PROTEIN: hypothetical protein M514_00970 [Trichuris suis]